MYTRCNMKVENKQDVLQRNLLKFYSTDTNMKKLFQLVASKNSDISLREWDYLCTHYAKKHNVLYYTSKKELVNLNLQYRSQLKAYSKANFDPFKRHNRIVIPCKYTPTNVLETTCGQLCFFKFVIEKDMYDWVKRGKNLTELRNDMNQYTKGKKTKASAPVSTIEKKRQVQKTNKQINRHDIKITVVF